MLCDEDCQTTGVGKTERPVGWEGNGETSCNANEALQLGNLAATDRLLLPMPSHSFTLDLVILVKSRRAGRRVMAKTSSYLTQKLKLKVNREKSRVVKVKDLEYLEFTFRGIRIFASSQALQDFKHRLKGLTSRSWGASMAGGVGEES